MIYYKLEPNPNLDRFLQKVALNSNHHASWRIFVVTLQKGKMSLLHQMYIIF